MNKLTTITVVAAAAILFGIMTPDLGLLAAATGSNNDDNKNNHGDDNHHDDKNSNNNWDKNNDDDNGSKNNDDDNGWDHKHDDHNYDETKMQNESPTITVYKIVENTQGSIPSVSSFGMSLNNTQVATNGTMFTVSPNKPVILTESGLSGYEFAEIRGDGHCPENLGGTITLDYGQHIECYVVNRPVGSDGEAKDLPTVKIYKVVINNEDDNIPEMVSFGVRLNNTQVATNGTSYTLSANKPVALTENGLEGYEFVEIRGDGHCPENLGGTITLDYGQHIECYIIDQPESGPIQPGVIFHYNTLQFSFDDPSYGDSCSAPGKVPPCVELANSKLDGSVLVVDDALKTDTTIVLFSVVEEGKIDQDPQAFATSPLCVLSGMGPHTSDYAQEPELFPVENPSGQLGFEFQCSLIEANMFKVSYALIETQR